MTGSTHSDPRFLLRQLRHIMLEALDPQERLNRIVSAIATNLNCSVCSLYILRADMMLELYASQGLNAQAVHRTTLRFGEGLVGKIAAEATPLNLPDAPTHPSFLYRPETGEERYHAFLGVPVLRAGRMLGVLIVQDTSCRVYLEDDVETLQTSAMVIAEMLLAEDLKKISSSGAELDLSRPEHLSGLVLSEGIGLGHCVLHEPRLVVTELIAEDITVELQRLDEALSALRLTLDKLLSKPDMLHQGEHRDVLEAYRMFAYDSGWIHRIRDAIQNGLTAEAAVERVQSKMRAHMLRQTDPYLQERLHDLDDLGNRLIRQLMGYTSPPKLQEIPKDTIIVARNMGAAELLDYDAASLRGVALEEGTPPSHVTIVAKALGIPLIGQVTNLLAKIEAGDPLIVDAERGEVHLRPLPDMIEVYAEKLRFRARRQACYRALRSVPACSKDGVPIELKLNAGLLIDLPSLEESGASGIGLFRTELQFMVASSLPRLEEQKNFYRQIIEHAGGKPVTFRSLDIGGDKILPYIRSVQEENPAMGWRAIRFSLDRPALLRIQTRALLHACAEQELRLIFPMITDLSEIRQSRALVEKEIAHFQRHGHALPRRILLGAMIEVPALLFQLEAVMKEVDFVSVGSNDLYQFFNAADRSNIRVAQRFDPLSPPFLRALKLIVDTATSTQTPVTLCGELAGDPLGAIALFALGYRSVSMPASSIGPVKAALLKVNLQQLHQALIPHLMPGQETKNLRSFLKDFAKMHQIPL